MRLGTYDKVADDILTRAQKVKDAILNLEDNKLRNVLIKELDELPVGNPEVNFGKSLINRYQDHCEQNFMEFDRKTMRTPEVFFREKYTEKFLDSLGTLYVYVNAAIDVTVIQKSNKEDGGKREFPTARYDAVSNDFVKNLSKKDVTDIDNDKGFSHLYDTLEIAYKKTLGSYFKGPQIEKQATTYLGYIHLNDPEKGKRDEPAGRMNYSIKDIYDYVNVVAEIKVEKGLDLKTEKKILGQMLFYSEFAINYNETIMGDQSLSEQLKMDGNNQTFNKLMMSKYFTKIHEGFNKYLNQEEVPLIESKKALLAIDQGLDAKMENAAEIAKTINNSASRFR